MERQAEKSIELIVSLVSSDSITFCETIKDESV